MDCVALNGTQNQAWATGSTKIYLVYPKILTGKISGRTLNVEGSKALPRALTHLLAPSPATLFLTPSTNMLTHIPTHMGLFLSKLTFVMAVPSTLNVLLLKKGNDQIGACSVDVSGVSCSPECKPDSLPVGASHLLLTNLEAKLSILLFSSKGNPLHRVRILFVHLFNN